MSESTESWIKPIIFIVTFLGLFIMLLGLMPSGFTPPSHTYALYDLPDNFNPAELSGVQYFLQSNVTFGGVWVPNYVTFDFNTATPKIDRVFAVLGFGDTYGYGTYLQFRHLVWAWGPTFLWQWDTMTVGVNATFPYSIYRSSVVEAMDAGNKAKFAGINCAHATFTAWVSDGNATRNDVLTSWDEGTIKVSIGMGLNATEGAYGGWDILGRLLTFQAPEILGLTGDGAVILNYAIALPIWAMIGYLITRLLILIFKPFG